MQAASFLGRFWLGMLSGLLTGFLVFRWDLLRPQSPAFHCVTVGALLAATLALFRVDRPAWALLLCAAVAVFGALDPTSSGMLGRFALPILAGGILTIALIFDLVARRGLLFGKFVLIGPLLGGVYLAMAPFAQFESLTPLLGARILLERVLLGVVIGDGVALGVEGADLLSRRRAAAGAGHPEALG